MLQCVNVGPYLVVPDLAANGKVQVASRHHDGPPTALAIIPDILTRMTRPGVLCRLALTGLLASFCFCSATFRLDLYVSLSGSSTSAFLKDPVWRMTILNGASPRPAREYAHSTPLRWDRSPEDIRSESERLVNSVKEVYDEIGRLRVDAVCVENTLRALANVKMDYAVRRHALDFPQYVSPCQAVRSASVEADRRLCDFDVELSMRDDVFLRIAALQKTLPENVSAEEKRFLERLVSSGRRNGLHLSADTREKIKRKSKLISELSIEFNKNLNEDNTFLLFSEKQLGRYTHTNTHTHTHTHTHGTLTNPHPKDGMAENFLSGLDVDEASGLYKVTLAYPHYFPVMKRCRHPETRRRMETAFHSRCKEANTLILERLVALRAEVASLLGFSCHADYVLEVNVAKDATNVDAFLSGAARVRRGQGQTAGVLPAGRRHRGPPGDLPGPAGAALRPGAGGARVAPGRSGLRCPRRRHRRGDGPLLPGPAPEGREVRPRRVLLPATRVRGPRRGATPPGGRFGGQLHQTGCGSALAAAAPRGGDVLSRVWTRHARNLLQGDLFGVQRHAGGNGLCGGSVSGAGELGVGEGAAKEDVAPLQGRLRHPGGAARQAHRVAGGQHGVDEPAAGGPE
ncbi:neurolysin, mitochondrial isoform X6 [Vanacampus margaritifer]